MNAKRRSYLAATFALLGSFAVNAETLSLAKTFEGTEAVDLFQRYCSACHAWADSYDTIVAEGRISPGDPAGSAAFAAIESGAMPPGGPGPNQEEIQGLGAWITEGALKPQLGAASGLGAASASVANDTKYMLFFDNSTQFHRVSGWTSAGLFLAAGVVGAVHAYDLISEAHAYRDALGITEDLIGAQCAAEIRSLWSASGQQALRWTHVALLSAGETLYLANALTGISFIGDDGPGVSKSDLHRWGFYIHAALMASEMVMGYFTSEALRAGDHEMLSSLGVAHAAVGLAIPLVIIASGSLMSR